MSGSACSASIQAVAEQTFPRRIDGHHTAQRIEAEHADPDTAQSLADTNLQHVCIEQTDAQSQRFFHIAAEPGQNGEFGIGEGWAPGAAMGAEHHAHVRVW